MGYTVVINEIPAMPGFLPCMAFKRGATLEAAYNDSLILYDAFGICFCH